MYKTLSNISTILNKYTIILSFFLISPIAITSIKQYKIEKIVIDPGHGGRDPGCINVKHNVKEKDICLKIAKKLGKKIESNFLNVKVIYTRSSDIFKKLKERSDLANKIKADLFISIHCNFSKDEKICGFETYILEKPYTNSNTYTYNNRSFKTVQRENKVILMEKNYKKKYKYNHRLINSRILCANYENAYHHGSIKFAEIILKNIQKIGRKIRNVMEGPFHVLRESALISVLAEIGFISNSKELLYLNSNEGQEKIANALFQSIKEYKITLEKNI